MLPEKQQSRRRFLQQAAAAIAWTMGLAGPQVEALTRQAPYSPRSGEYPSAETDHTVFLPFLVGGHEKIHGPSRQAYGPSKLGVHTIRPDGATDIVRQVSDAGAHVALVKGVDDLGYLRLVKEMSPETTRVARRQIPDYSGIDARGNPVSKAQGYMARHMALWEPDRAIVDYWEVLNEPDPPGVAGHRWLGEFYAACMEIADEQGYKLAIFSYSVGVPEWEEWDAIVETEVFRQAKDGGHILSLHEYNWPYVDLGWGAPLPGRPSGFDRGILTGRYRHLYEDFLIPRNQVVPLAITEAGYDPSVVGQGWDDDWKDRYVSEMAWYDEKLRQDEYVIGCALFTLGGVAQWQKWDYSELLPELAQHIISLKDVP
jgi:hypothetical protein